MGHGFPSPFEMYGHIAITNAEYEGMGRMRSGESAKNEQCACDIPESRKNTENTGGGSGIHTGIKNHEQVEVTEGVNRAGIHVRGSFVRQRVFEENP